MSGIQFYEEQTRFKSERNEVKEINENIVKVGSVYILTEEEYNHLCKCRSLLMDTLGTYKQFLQAYESFK